MVASLVAGLDIDFSRMMLVEIQKREFKNSTTYAFPYLIFQMFRDDRLSIWNYDILIQQTGMSNINIKYEVNMVPPCRGPHVKVPSFREDLANTVEQANGTDPSLHKNI